VPEPTPSEGGAPPPRQTPDSTADRPPRSGLETGHFLTILGIFASIFIGVGVWFHSDIQEGRQATANLVTENTALRERAAQLEGRLALAEQRAEQNRKELETWAAWMFDTTCDSVKGKYVGTAGFCTLPDNRFLKYRPPFP
jgi:hypothetical protein